MPSTPPWRRAAFLASSLATILLNAGCGEEEESAIALCETPCALDFFEDARRCAGIEGVDCMGPDCYANGARTYAVESELRDPGGRLCLKRWSTTTGLAWQTGEKRLRIDVESQRVTCPDGIESRTTDDDTAVCDPINQPSRQCNSGFCETPAPLICPARGCLCRESPCAEEFFEGVRECAGLTGEEACWFDETSGEACYSNGARVTGDATLRRLWAPDGERLCLTVSVGPATFPDRGYDRGASGVLTVDSTGKIVRCPDGTEELGCGSGAALNFDDGCDPTAIITFTCCGPGACGQ